jgi:hypothetical protein
MVRDPLTDEQATTVTHTTRIKTLLNRGVGQSDQDAGRSS